MDSTTAAILMYGDPDSLEHAGVKGMKWGVWKSESAKRKHGLSRSVKKLPTHEARMAQLKKVDSEWASSLNDSKKLNKSIKKAKKISKRIQKKRIKELKNEGYTFGPNNFKKSNINNHRNELRRLQLENDIKNDEANALNEQLRKRFKDSPSGFYTPRAKSVDGKMVVYGEATPNPKATKQLNRLDKRDKRREKRARQKMSKAKAKAAKVKHDVFGDPLALEHAGVKGMKWGVWRSESAKRKHGMGGERKKAKGGSKAERERIRAAKKKAKNDVKIAKIKADAAKKKAKYAKQAKLSTQEAKAVTAAKKRSQTKMSTVKSASEMSSEEMQAAVNRYNLEKSYNRMLQEQNPSKKKKSEVAAEYTKSKMAKTANYVVDATLRKAGDRVADAIVREIIGSTSANQAKNKKKSN